MCDIWKNNAQVKSLDIQEVERLLDSLRRLQTRWVVLSGGEALMNPRLFEICKRLKQESIKITILSTGILLKKYAQEVVAYSDEVIVSLDGSETIHNAVRQLPNAYQKLQSGVAAVKAVDVDFPISARCVIQRLNWRDWPNIVIAAKTLKLSNISFLAADISTDAFNHVTTDEQTKRGLLPTTEDLSALRDLIATMEEQFAPDFKSGFITESPSKLYKIYEYYAACHKQQPFPAVRCNAPWVSAVIEADGEVKPCFFHPSIGNIHKNELNEILNAPQAQRFRENLNVSKNEICRKCVCTLNWQTETSLSDYN
jgi:Fe-coproporphyrin III synthase